jgi:threonine dehydrogenase-like Zn-dependent dehydrogenase
LGKGSLRDDYRGTKEVSISDGNSRDEFAATFDAIVGGRLDAQGLLSRSVGLSGVAEAFDSLRREARDIKVVVDTTPPRPV